MTFSDFAQETRQQSWKQEGEVLQIILEVLELHFSLLRHPFTLELTEDNKLQRVWLELTTSAFHSLRIGYDALESGYYSQCFTLTRVALEDWLAAVDCQSHSETIEALLDSAKPRPSVADMAGRLPERYKNLWRSGQEQEDSYGFLSTFTHTRQRALEAVKDVDGTLLIFPRYIEIRFAMAAYYLVRCALPILDFLERLADYLATPEAQEWKDQDLQEVHSKGFQVFDALLRRLNSYRRDN